MKVNFLTFNLNHLIGIAYHTNYMRSQSYYVTLCFVLVHSHPLFHILHHFGANNVGYTTFSYWTEHYNKLSHFHMVKEFFFILKSLYLKWGIYIPFSYSPKKKAFSYCLLLISILLYTHAIKNFKKNVVNFFFCV